MAAETKKTKPSGGTGRALRRWSMRIGFAIVGVGVIGAIVLAWMPKPIAVEVTSVRRGTLRVTVEEDGRTRVKDRYVISAPLAGNLARIELEPGDRVEAGAVIARLLPLPAPLLDPQSRAQAQARLSAAEASFRQAQSAEARARAARDFSDSQIESQRQLAARGSIAPRALDRAEFELRTRREEVSSAAFGVRVARQEVEMARAALGRFTAGRTTGDEMEITSSVTGVVLEVQRQNEGVVQAGTPLVEIGDPAALEIVVDVLTTDAVRIQPGARARIVRWGGAGELAAHVRRVEPKATTAMSSLGVEEQRVNVVLDLDAPRESWAALGDGYRVEASIVVWEEPNVVRVPVSAVFRRDDRWAVFVVDGEIARMRHVAIGQRNGLEAQILRGLSTRERVLVHPGERVTDGTRIVAR